MHKTQLKSRHTCCASSFITRHGNRLIIEARVITALASFTWGSNGDRLSDGKKRVTERKRSPLRILPTSGAPRSLNRRLMIMTIGRRRAAVWASSLHLWRALNCTLYTRYYEIPESTHTLSVPVCVCLCDYIVKLLALLNPFLSVSFVPLFKYPMTRNIISTRLFPPHTLLRPWKYWIFFLHFFGYTIEKDDSLSQFLLEIIRIFNLFRGRNFRWELNHYWTKRIISIFVQQKCSENWSAMDEEKIHFSFLVGMLLRKFSTIKCNWWIYFPTSRSSIVLKLDYQFTMWTK